MGRERVPVQYYEFLAIDRPLDDAEMFPRE
jgi:hypothetical protein